MTPKRKQKLALIGLMFTGISVAVGLSLYALSANINAFYAPMQIVNGEAPLDRTIRAGGMVVAGSVARDETSLQVRFAVTDHVEQVWIQYDKILPDLFREGQGVVVVGRLNEAGDIVASEVLARHDENYMPPEVAAALEAAGQMPSHSPFRHTSSSSSETAY